jgi:competence protein ComGC
MEFSPILSSLSDLLQNLAEAFAANPGEVLLVNILLIVFLTLVFVPSLLHTALKYLRQKAQAKKTYQSVIKKYNLSLEELQVLNKLTRHVQGGLKKKQLLVLKASVFNHAVKALLAKENVPAALITALRLKLGFVAWSNDGPVHSTAELPKGLRLYILPKNGREFYARLIQQTSACLLVRKEDKEKTLPAGLAWVIVFFEKSNGIFSFSTLVKKVENDTILYLTHSEKIVQNQHRRYYRRKIYLPVSLRQYGMKQPLKKSTITDLGGGGISLLNPENAFKPHDRLVLYFFLPTGKRIALTGKVLRSSHYERYIHLAFEPMDEYMRDSIMGYLLNARG